mgnify:CR=1 FL=1
MLSALFQLGKPKRLTKKWEDFLAKVWYNSSAESRQQQTERGDAAKDYEENNAKTSGFNRNI